MSPDRVDLESELDAVAAALSHDLRAPLRAIDGFSAILLGDEERAAALPDDTRRWLELVREAGAELAARLDGLVDVVRVTRAELVVRDGVDLGVLADELVAAKFDGREGVAWSIDRGVPACRADQTLARRLLEELLDNASRFGAARVEVGWDDAERAWFVRDDGAGFDGELPAQALAIFGRLGAGGAAEGTGVGLAIATRIVARHGGRLWGRGARGEGATVWFTLG